MTIIITHKKDNLRVKSQINGSQRKKTPEYLLIKIKKPNTNKIIFWFDVIWKENYGTCRLCSTVFGD